MGDAAFYDPVTDTYSGVSVDAILRHLDQESDRTSIELTLYLAWGIATGITVPGSYFGHYVAHFFTRNDAGDITDRLAALDAEQDRLFVHLPESGRFLGFEHMCDGHLHRYD